MVNLLTKLRKRCNYDNEIIKLLKKIKSLKFALEFYQINNVKLRKKKLFEM